MSWKDWLYIPRMDKIAIVGLLIIIAMLMGIIYLTRKDETHSELDVEQLVPEDYKAWQAQLIEQKEEEKQTFQQEYKKRYPQYQPKMELGETIELNAADTTHLKTIPGIGSGYANRIVNYRESLGGFVNIEQLLEIWGMDTYLYSQIIQYIILDSHYRPLYINKNSFEQLLKHPYLNYKQVLVIDDIRSRKGAIKSLRRLALLEEFSRRDIERLAIYANFDEE